MEDIENMIVDVGPSDLMPEHSRLLKVDYEKLGKGNVE